MKQFQVKKASLRKEVSSTENALDEVQRRRRLHEEAYSVVQGFLQEGYDADLLLSLMEPLKSLSVKDHPRTSLDRFVKGLGGYKKLMELEDAVSSKEIELSNVTAELLSSRASLKAFNFDILKELEDAKNRSIQKITDQTKAAIEDTSKLRDESIDSLKKIQDAHEKTLDQLKNLGMGYVEDTSNSSLKEIRTVTQDLKTTIEGYEKVIREWGETKQQYGEFKEVMPYAQVIHDAM